MSPDQSAPVSEPVAPSGDASSSARSEPAPSTSERLGTLAEAFRNDPGALKDRTPQERAARPPAGDESPEESASGPDASKPGEDRPSTGQPSRRGAAAKIGEQQAEIDRLVAEREAERARANEHEARVREHESARETARQSALARIGDDREFGALLAKRIKGEVLSYEDDEKLSSQLAWREHAADLWEMTDRAHKTALATGVADRVDRYGLDKQQAFTSSLPDLLDHAVSVTEARVRKEQANTIAELKAELKGLRTRGARAASPTVGGSSDGSGDGLPGDGASPLDWFRAGARKQEAERSGAGRNGRH